MSYSDNKKKGWSTRSVLGTFAVAGVAIGPLWSSFQPVKHTAYKDDAGKPAICFGHTKNVKMSDTATDAQCQAFLEQDYTDAVTFVITQSPAIINHTNRLKAASHYTISRGQDAYAQSPMLDAFKKEQWAAGCKAFAGYDIHYRYKFKRFGAECTQQKDKTWVCAEPSLIAARKNEMKLCLTPSNRSIS